MSDKSKTVIFGVANSFETAEKILREDFKDSPFIEYLLITENHGQSEESAFEAPGPTLVDTLLSEAKRRGTRIIWSVPHRSPSSMMQGVNDVIRNTEKRQLVTSISGNRIDPVISADPKTDVSMYFTRPDSPHLSFQSLVTDIPPFPICACFQSGAIFCFGENIKIEQSVTAILCDKYGVKKEQKRDLSAFYSLGYQCGIAIDAITSLSPLAKHFFGIFELSVSNDALILRLIASCDGGLDAFESLKSAEYSGKHQEVHEFGEVSFSLPKAKTNRIGKDQLVTMCPKPEPGKKYYWGDTLLEPRYENWKPDILTTDHINAPSLNVEKNCNTPDENHWIGRKLGKKILGANNDWRFIPEREKSEIRRVKVPKESILLRLEKGGLSVIYDDLH